MEQVTYRTEVRRKRGKWVVSVPALPPDAPRVVTDKLGNAAPLMIEQIAHYLGVSVAVVAVEVEQPSRPARRGLGDLVTAGAVQLGSGVGALAGLYMLAGTAVTLITASIATAAVAALREAGRI